MSILAFPTGTWSPDDAVAQACLRALAAYLGCKPGEIDEACRALDLANDAIIVVDTHRRIVYCNARTAELTATPREKLIGQRCAEGIGFVTCGKHCHLFEDGGVCERSCELEPRGGRARLVVKNARLFRDEDGRVVGGIESMQDVTDLWSPQQIAACPPAALNLECQLLDAFVRTVGGGAAALDPEGRIACISSEAASLLGGTVDTIRGRRLSELLEHADELPAALNEVLRTGATRELLGPRPSADAERRLLLRLAPVFGETGTPVGATVVLRVAAANDGRSFYGIVGASTSMQRLYRAIEVLAQSDVTVLITGESGVGKEMIARALHLAGPRRERPFMAVNCAALAEPLLESELFGYERGAFTGAVQAKPGRLELCADGTFLFDEIGCLSLGLQAKLLRVLEQREFERVGGTRSLPMRARIVAATNADLEELVRAGGFRHDLYYRLRVVPLGVPSLRERRGDIEPLAQHFLAELRAAGAKNRRAVEGFTPAALAAMTGYVWPGNVRELRNAIEYALAMGTGLAIDVADLPAELQLAAAQPAGADERARIEVALREARYNRSRAARLLGMSRTTLWRKMQLYGLE